LVKVRKSIKNLLKHEKQAKITYMEKKQIKTNPKKETLACG